MRIVLFKVSEKGRVRQVLEPRGVLGHHIVRSWEVEVYGAVPMLSLEGTGVVAQVSGSFVTGHRAFAHPGDCRNVVSSVGDGGVPYVKVVGHEGRLR